ncbi:phosphoesterase PA-phosphatase related protein [Emticicia oligotrophica DSM 17448]|uniref:Phosphoesterase PA-phosphatase related protein n=1 Tax=Emticicia oligotrophica (strain DSM 17448 / CIP 109782 / MTCC 6937 / GPTSA100-15) TaxID=929562 RepID=A0ABN4ANN6_EMTOG|nr:MULTISPECIES: vanadium-dependent haloperoxidase [Emticicia]AFK03768.1 phosphoesterase PA-phosphatase related protein [Emticicia oligotrophica DSM 17448]
MKNIYPQGIKVGLLTLVLCTLLIMNGCESNNGDNPIPVAATDTTTASAAIRWGKMSLFIAEKTPGNSPTYASRGFGYIGLTMYESIVGGFKAYNSLAGQLNGLVTLPKIDSTQRYNWVLSLNAGQSWIHKNIYEQTSEANKRTIDSLEAKILSEYKAENQAVIERSVKYGQEVAKAIFEWSKTDGGYQGYNRNFTTDYVLPVGPGYWKSPQFSQSPSTLPLHPYWGKNRTFVSTNSSLAVPRPITFNSSSYSQYYAQFLEVYAKNQVLTQEEKEIALFWGDDPSRTFTPPGHSYSIARIVVRTAKPPLIKAAQTFAMVGMAIGDAFINCWKAKYTYHAERPSTFIRTYIDASWLPFWPEPPFPAFYSGHSVQSAASATVLTKLYGDEFKYVDNSHEGRGQDPLTFIFYKNRSYSSFWEAAQESAYSRLLGGIHNRSDNDTGLAEGRKIGQNVNALKWLK